YDFREMIKIGKKYYFDAVLGKGNLVVIFDSFTPIMQAVELKKAIKFLQSMRYASRVGRAIGLATLQMNVHPPEVESAFLQLTDGIVEMRRKTDRGSVIRTLRIVKMSKTLAYEAYCPMDITEKGILIHKMPMTSASFDLTP
ncbi:MAG: RAD55 family ATPase, partial [Candidatus Bathyarchaeia archaeon]